jgi:hypothetical protein
LTCKIPGLHIPGVAVPKPAVLQNHLGSPGKAQASGLRSRI